MSSFQSLFARFVVVTLILFMACSKASTDEKKSVEASTTGAAPNDGQETFVVDDEYRTWDTVAYETLVSQLPAFDLNQDLSTKSLEELRILRNTIPARKGYLFMNADLRYYFYSTPWYRRLMEARWYGDCEYSGLKQAPPIAYTQEETAFMEKISKLEAQKRAQNYIVRNGMKYANVSNIVNAWQFGGLPAPLLNGLDRNGFAIVPAQHVQLFHTYEQNDYSQTQNFVSTDLYLQLFHMHFSFMLRGLEENSFVPILGELLYGIEDVTKRLAHDESSASRKADLEYTQAFYAVPLALLGGEPTITAPYSSKVEGELDRIEKEQSATSGLLAAYATAEFPYDMFKPRGHYTRTDTLKRYFRSMQWLQLGAYCMEDDADLRRALTAAFVLKTGKSRTGRPLVDLYSAILEPTTFLIGKPDNLSLLDLCTLLRDRNITTLADLLKPESITSMRTALTELSASKNVIKPKIENTCREKINFMPARFVLDSEILQEMTDLDARPYPRGLDVLASFGSQASEEILVNDLKEDKSWNKFLPQLEKMKTKYKNYEGWDESVYAKWIDGLNKLLVPDKRYPSFMQLPSWKKKNLNTALASWAELKHDAILYTEQPMAAECGGGEECSPPPEPYVLGYVEPNTNYWKSAMELLTLTSQLLEKHGLLDNRINGRQSQLRDLCAFLLSISEKELRGEKLLEQEYRTIEIIGTTVENITLSIMDTWSWDYISGPDREIAVVADIYTNNQPNKPGILHAAVGYGNDLYVVVEIEGYLYVTKGSTFSYYEFPVPLNNRLTDEEWQEMLKNGKAFPLQPWMEDVIIKLDGTLTPQVKEYLYSSGC
ncbi:DUF3160 domain-containing protein [Fulvivirgaceae bacterium PWU4]|uniref:DUF3160 domain-containing protein n=1 Tax=Chryseosolibacter histidini TaxID=2782349 RepID=A0AAP2GNL9_9BACT|nr:DUF3160 domain-containing protein [Chryseosolibacter histidini]MBT1697030.1 DUF3160 domain-containing protein [Chryseosolibacter histidini]